jgi:hypothetical protein
MNIDATATQNGVLPFSQSREDKTSSPATIATEHSLLAIDRELDSLLDQMQEELEGKGEASPESMVRFQQFCEAFGEKVDRIGRFIRVMEARAAYCKAESARLGARAKSADTKVEQTKSLVLFYLASRNLAKMEGKEFTLRRQKNSQDSVRIDCPEGIPMRLQRVEARFDGVLWERILAVLSDDLKAAFAGCMLASSPVNDAIKSEIAAGGQVEGATVSRGYHLRVA